jgi:hypothetical protein
MNYAKRRGRVFAVAVLTVFSMTMLVASAAQAVGEPLEWGISFKTLGELGLTEESVTGINEGISTFSVPAQNLEINCKALDIFEANITTSGAGKATLLYLECTVLENTVGPPVKLGELPCEIVGGDITIKVKMQGLKHNSEKFLLFSPLTGSTLTTIEYKKGTGCPVLLKVELKGTIVFQLETSLMVNPLKPAADTGSMAGKTLQALFGASLKYGLSEMFLTSKMAMELNGPKHKESWGLV